MRWMLLIWLCRWSSPPSTMPSVTSCLGSMLAPPCRGSTVPCGPMISLKGSVMKLFLGPTVFMRSRPEGHQELPLRRGEQGCGIDFRFWGLEERPVGVGRPKLKLLESSWKLGMHGN